MTDGGDRSDETHATYRLAVLASLLLALSAATAQIRELDTSVPASAGPAPVAVRIAVPEQARDPDGAPVVVHVTDGWANGDLSRLGAPLATQGFVEVRFSFPDPLDQRGPLAAGALADVLAFAAGGRDTAGRTLADFAAPITPLTDRLGVIGWGLGGNVTVVALARHAAASRAVDWLVMWETPAIDGSPTALLGNRETGPLPVYDPVRRTVAIESLKYDPALPVPGRAGPGARGALWFDADRDGRRTAADPTPEALPVPFGERLRYAYPAWLTAAAERARLAVPWPPHLLNAAEAEDFWNVRLAAGQYAAAAGRRLDRLVMIVGNIHDHSQAAPDHPHIFAAYDGWRQTDTWTRLNPDREYVLELAGQAAEGYTDNLANRLVERTVIPAMLAPEPLGPATLVTAAACELADRVRDGQRADDMLAPLKQD